MDTPQAYYDDEIDLREIIQTLLKGWKVILLLTILAGAIAFGISMAQTPVYKASATVSINQTALSISTNPASMLLGDEMRQAVADALDVSAASLPVPEIANDKTDKALFIISVQSPDAQFAAQAANAWAQAGVDYSVEQASSTALVDNAREIFTQADQALLSYMQKNRMGGLAWGELAWLTGIGAGQAPPPESANLPTLTQKQRLDLAALMQARVAAGNVSSKLMIQATEVRYALSVNPPVALRRAAVPVEPVSPKVMQNTALGLAAGLMLGVFWVFAAAWWRGSGENE